MIPQASTSTTLNPFAPEYNPIPPGITPPPHAPTPFFLPPPPSASFHQLPPPLSSSSLERPPPLFLPPQIFTYIPSSSQQHSYTNYSTYCVTSQNPPLTIPPLPPPQPEVGRGWTRRKRGFGGGRRRGKENSWSSRVDKNGRGFNSSFERKPSNNKNKMGFSKDEKFSTWGSMQKDENRHKVMPLKRDEEKTTIMIKNIPYDCPRKELISLLDDFCLLENEKAGNEGTSRKEADREIFTYAYDFLYLPIDFRSKRSRGFAFVNFTNARAVWKFFDSFHLKKWDFVVRNKWPKKIEIVCAKIQGKENLVNHFSESIFECETDEFLPACFSPPRDGSGQPVKLTVVGNRRAASHREHRK